MEKFSNYRDAGTGIQPFLTPVPPAGSEFLGKASLPLRYALAVIRTALILVLVLAYLLVVRIALLVFSPIPPLYDFLSHLLTKILGRCVLFIAGLFWIQVEQTTRKRKTSAKAYSPWDPKPGDIIVSNWVSWIELIWLAIQFNPIFVLPIPASGEKTTALDSTPSPENSPITYNPGRRTGTGSANIQQKARSPSSRVPIAGFQKVSLLSIVASTGRVPPFSASSDLQSIEDIRRTARRPIVVFPECTTSNGRGLLRFANVFNLTVPVKGFDVYVMCVRYDPPTSLSPSLSHSMPSAFLNPFPHIFSLTTSPSPLSMSIRLLALSDSPSSQLFMASEHVSGAPGEDQLAESCAALISQIGKFKQTAMGWEDKASLLQFLSGNRR